MDTPYLKRGTRGRFVSKKKIPEILPDATAYETITTTFYGSPITKYLIKDVWYFSISDVVATGKPDPLLQEVTYSEQFEEVKKENSIVTNTIPVANAQGMIKIIKEVNALFPGPLSRWLMG